MNNRVKRVLNVIATFFIIASLSIPSFAETAVTTFSAKTSKAEAGKEMTVTVKVDNNAGFANGKIKIEFDDTVIKYKSYHDESIMSTAITQVGGTESNFVKYAFVFLDNVSENGDLFTLTFDVLPDTELKTSNIIITIEELVDANTDAEVKAKTVNTAVTVEDKVKFIKGDVDGNGQITLNDAMYVIMHVAKKEFLTDEMLPPADVNGDDVITLNDAMAIIMHVAKKEEITSNIVSEKTYY